MFGVLRELEVVAGGAGGVSESRSRRLWISSGVGVTSPPSQTVVCPQLLVGVVSRIEAADKLNFDSSERVVAAAAAPA